MKSLFILLLMLMGATAHAQVAPTVVHCRAQCIAYEYWTGYPTDLGQVDGLSRSSQRRASELAYNQCRDRLRHLGWPAVYDLRSLSCWEEREDEIDVPYTGSLPVRG